MKALNTPESKINAKETSTQEDAALPFLTKRQKVAAILVAMGQTRAASILHHFSKEDLLLLNGVAQTLPVIPPADLALLVEEFERQFADGAVLSEAGPQFNKLLKEAMGDEFSAALLSLPKEEAKPNNIWDDLAELAPEKLYTYLYDEHPQIFAYIFSRLPSDVASQLLLYMPAEERSDIVKRRLLLKDIATSSIEIIEKALRKKLARRIDHEYSSNYLQVTNIFNNLTKEQIDTVLADLKDLDENDLANIKARLFVFEDLPRLSKEARLLVFDAIDIDTIIASLSGTTDEFKEILLESLSQRIKRLVMTELSAGNENIKPSEIISARRKIAQKAIELADKGIISIEQI